MPQIVVEALSKSYRIAEREAVHGTNADVADWRGMLSAAGFAIDDEGTKRGLAWILATRVCESSQCGSPHP